MNSVTEDWALGMRFKKLGYRCRYVNVRFRACHAALVLHALLPSVCIWVCAATLCPRHTRAEAMLACGAFQVFSTLGGVVSVQRRDDPEEACSGWCPVHKSSSRHASLMAHALHPRRTLQRYLASARRRTAARRRSSSGRAGARATSRCSTAPECPLFDRRLNPFFRLAYSSTCIGYLSTGALRSCADDQCCLLGCLRVLLTQCFGHVQLWRRHQAYTQFLFLLCEPSPASHSVVCMMLWPYEHVLCSCIWQLTCFDCSCCVCVCVLCVCFA